MISGFLHESIVPGPWSNILKYLPKMFLRRYLQKDLQPPGSCTQRLQKWSRMTIFFCLQLITQGMHQSTIGDFCIDI